MWGRILRMRHTHRVCAQATALAVMASHGNGKLRSLTVCDSGLATSCGGCRQKIREYATSETIIHTCSRNGLWATYTMDGLLQIRSVRSIFNRNQRRESLVISTQVFCYLGWCDYVALIDCG